MKRINGDSTNVIDAEIYFAYKKLPDKYLQHLLWYVNGEKITNPSFPENKEDEDIVFAVLREAKRRGMV